MAEAKLCPNHSKAIRTKKKASVYAAQNTILRVMELNDTGYTGAVSSSGRMLVL